MSGIPSMAGEPGFDRWGRSIGSPFIGSAVAESGPTEYVIGLLVYGGEQHAVALGFGVTTGVHARGMCGARVYVLGNGGGCYPWDPSPGSCAPCVEVVEKARADLPAD